MHTDGLRDARVRAYTNVRKKKKTHLNRGVGKREDDLSPIKTIASRPRAGLAFDGGDRYAAYDCTAAGPGPGTCMRCYRFAVSLTRPYYLSCGTTCAGVCYSKYWRGKGLHARIKKNICTVSRGASPPRSNRCCTRTQLSRFYFIFIAHGYARRKTYTGLYYVHTNGRQIIKLFRSTNTTP
jgi:hypothetical protein